MSCDCVIRTEKGSRLLAKLVTTPHGPECQQLVRDIQAMDPSKVGWSYVRMVQYSIDLITSFPKYCERCGSGERPS